MLDMGFTDDIESILESTPEDRQTVLFSATMPKRITSIAKRYQRDPERITIGHPDAEPGAKALVRQTVYVVQRAHKPSALGRILDIEAPKSALGLLPHPHRGRPADRDDERPWLPRRGAPRRHGSGPARPGDGTAARRHRRVAGRHRRRRPRPRHRHPHPRRELRRALGGRELCSPDRPSGRAGREGVAITLAEPRERRASRTSNG